MTDYADEYLPHEAVVDSRPGRPWEGGPWPWCPKAERRNPLHAGQPVEEWPVTAPAVPHDGHTVNEGNSWCEGVPGTVPGKPVSELRARIERAERRVEAARRTLDGHLDEAAALKAALVKLEAAPTPS